jgi:hypothetical protein
MRPVPIGTDTLANERGRQLRRPASCIERRAAHNNGPGQPCLQSANRVRGENAWRWPWSNVVIRLRGFGGRGTESNGSGKKELVVQVVQRCNFQGFVELRR